ncbi:MAG: DUF72 domain-containing protein [Phycisphaerae bacterium]
MGAQLNLFDFDPDADRAGKPRRSADSRSRSAARGGPPPRDSASEPPNDASAAHPSPHAAHKRVVGPAPPTHDSLQLAQRLPATVWLGTSSWSFPGWTTIVYDRPATESQLARHGLAAYAQHPLLRMVGIDRTYYAPIPASAFAAYAAVTPPNFRFLVKAHELCLLPRFGAANRYGRAGGEDNQRFLDPHYAAEQVVAPAVEGLGARLGPIVFQFSPLDLRPVGGAARLLDRLAAFLEQLPRGPLYAVELRSRKLLTSRYADLLTATGACHCYNAHPSMPPIDEQAALLAPAAQPALVVRWMLFGQNQYEEARERYAPFNRLVDEDPRTRGAVAIECLNAAARGKPAFVVINNKAEGSAPLSLFALAQEIVRLTTA